MRLVLALLVALALAQAAPSAAAQEATQEEGCRAPILDIQAPPETFRPGRAYSLLVAIENPNRAPVDAVRASLTTTAPGGWTATPAQPELTLAPQDVAVDAITVAAPARGSGEPGGNLTILVTFVCTIGDVQTSASTQRSIPVHTEAFRAPWPLVLAAFGVLAVGVGALGVRRLRRGVALTCASPERLVAPGKSAKFDLHVENRRGRPQRLHMVATGAPDGWQVHLALPELVLEPGEQKTLWALLKAPTGAQAGDEAVVTLRLQSAGGGPEAANVVLRARVTE